MKPLRIEDTVKRIIWEVENKKVVADLETIIERDIYTFVKFGNMKDLDKRAIKRIRNANALFKQMKGR